MSPYEFDMIWTGWLKDAASASNASEAIAAIDFEVRKVQRDWRATWAAHGDAPDGWPIYAGLIRKLQSIATRHTAGRTPQRTGPGATHPDFTDTRAALAELREQQDSASRSPILARSPPRRRQPRQSRRVPLRACGESFDARPLIILCAPRSGSTLLFERLCACSPDWYTVGNESQSRSRELRR